MNDAMINMLIGLLGILITGGGALLYFKWEEHRTARKKHAH